MNIDESCTFTTKADQVKFFTQTNGDKLSLKGLVMNRQQAAGMAWLVNHTGELEFEIKVK